MKLSTSDLAVLNQKPHRSSLNLSIFQPQVVMKCRVNNPAIAVDARTIDFDTVSFGGYASVESGFTLLIGTSDGARDVGRIRIRSASASQFIVSENSNIQWADNLYLTVIHFVELWPIYPRLITDPSNVNNVLFYKDYDIAYTNQNSILGTFVNAGPHRASYIDGGSAQLYYTATGTLNLLGDNITYDWAFEGGNPTGSSLETPGYVSYISGGYYVTRLIVSDTNSVSHVVYTTDTTYRYVSIYDRPNAGPNTTPQRWELTKLDGTRDEGGYSATIRLYNPTGDIFEGALVTIFSDDWYGDTNKSLGGNAPNSSSIFFSGYILKDSINYNYADSYVEFEVGSITEVMKTSLGFAIDVQSDLSPAVWYRLLNMDCRRAIYHYLKWHTTVLSIADFQYIGSDYQIQYFDSDRASMFDAIDNFLRGTTIGRIVADRQGKIWAEADAEAVPNATGTYTQDMQITKSDWMNQPVLAEEIGDTVSYIEAGGIAFLGPSFPTGTPYMSNAPGSAPSFRGEVQTVEGLALTSQAQLNQLAGNLFVNRNAKYKTIDLDLAGNYRNLDIAPQSTSRIVIAPSDTVRGISLDQIYIPNSMSWTWDAEHQFLYPKTTFQVVKSGPPGETIIIPANPVDTGGGGGFGVPPITIPVIPPFTYVSGTGRCVIHLVSNMCATNMQGGVTAIWSLNTNPYYTNTLGACFDYDNVPSGTTPSGTFGTGGIKVLVPGWYRINFYGAFNCSTPYEGDRDYGIEWLGGIGGWMSTVGYSTKVTIFYDQYNNLQYGSATDSRNLAFSDLIYVPTVPTYFGYLRFISAYDIEIDQGFFYLSMELVQAG